MQKRMDADKKKRDVEEIKRVYGLGDEELG
jgi:hypothetical protein